MTDFVENWLFDPTVGKILTAVLVVLIVSFLIRIFNRFLLKYVKDNDTRYYTRKIVNFFGYLLAILAISIVYSDKLGGLTVALGVAGAGVAFALQEVISSIAGWFVISFSKFYKTGDRIGIGGTKGDIIDIGLLRTTIMEVGEWVHGDLYNGRVVRVANNFVFKDPVYNYSGDFPFLWDEITIPIKFGSDNDLFRKILNQIAEEVVGNYSRVAGESWTRMVDKYLIEDAQVEPMISMEFDENWITYTLRYVVDYKMRRHTKDALFQKIIKSIDSSGGRIQIASASYEINLIK